MRELGFNFSHLLTRKYQYHSCITFSNSDARPGHCSQIQGILFQTDSLEIQAFQIQNSKLFLLQMFNGIEFLYVRQFSSEKRLMDMRNFIFLCRELKYFRATPIFFQAKRIWQSFYFIFVQHVPGRLAASTGYWPTPRWTEPRPRLGSSAQDGRARCRM